MEITSNSKGRKRKILPTCKSPDMRECYHTGLWVSRTGRRGTEDLSFHSLGGSQAGIRVLPSKEVRGSGGGSTQEHLPAGEVTFFKIYITPKVIKISQLPGG